MLELALPVGNGLLERLRRRDCAEAELRAAADLRARAEPAGAGHLPTGA